MTTTMRAGGLCVLITLGACGGQTLDVGSNNGGGMGGTSSAASASQGNEVGGGAGRATSCPGDQPSHEPTGGTGPVATPPLPSWPDTSACIDGLGALEATWSGHDASGQLPDFTVSLQPSGALPCGTVTFGTPATFTPPTDATAAPPDLPHSKTLVPGFTYTMLAAETRDEDITFRISVTQPWQAWCKLQTPYCDEHYGGFYCSDAMSYTLVDDTVCHGRTSTNEDLGVVSCAQADICRAGSGPPNGYETCVCDASACDANQKGESIAFEFHTEGDAAQGVIIGRDSPIHLTRN